MESAFDREWVLAELLPSGELEKAGSALRELLGGDCAVLDAEGTVLWGSLREGAGREPLVVELEPVGYVAAAVPRPRLQAAAAVLRQILSARSRYLLAVSIHHQAVDADYEALRASESRYKALSEALEQRVEEQVARIEAQQRQLYVAEKAASVGQLAAGVAHEINNPIGFIRSNLNTFAAYLDKFAALKTDFSRAGETWKRLDLDFVLADGNDLLKECIDGADRVGHIVRDLKGFSNVDAPSEEVIDINECVRRAVAMVGNRRPPGVALELDLSPLPPRRCKPWQLAEALFNVLSNAVQAVGDAGEIRVASRAAGNELVVEIADNGCGIPREMLGKVFDPFYTTRTVGDGTGLGLTVTRDIVAAHGGDIAIASEPGRGTTVTLRFSR